MKTFLAIVFMSVVAYGGIVYADSTSTQGIVCASIADIGNLSGVLGCAGASSTINLDPQVHLSLDPSALSATVTVPELIASTTVSANVPINSPIPLPIQACALIVKKIVQGGTAIASDFMIHVLQSGSDITHSPQAGSVSGTTYTNINAGTYSVTETGGPSGYTASFSGDCDSNGVVHLSIDQTAVCTITNTFATSTATSTPGGGGGGTSTSTPPSGGGGGSSGGGGGGGANGPIPVPIGGGGPIVLPGGTVVTELGGISAVAPATSAESPESLPGIPNTGVDGTSAWLALVFSALVAILGTTALVRPKLH